MVQKFRLCPIVDSLVLIFVIFQVILCIAGSILRIVFSSTRNLEIRMWYRKNMLKYTTPDTFGLDFLYFMVNVGKCSIHAAYWNYIHLLISTSFTRPWGVWCFLSCFRSYLAEIRCCRYGVFVETPQNQGLWLNLRGGPLAVISRGPNNSTDFGVELIPHWPIYKVQ